MATAVPLVKNENGKRERGQMDTEDSEFTPLSKRINNLHLHQMQQGLNGTGTSHDGLIASDHVNGFGNGQNDGDRALNNGYVNRNESCSSEEASFLNSHNRRLESQDNNRQNGHGVNVERFQSSSVHQELNYMANGSNGFHGEDLNQHGHGPGQHSPYENGSAGEELPYRPSLTAEANPHYYESNKQLYLLYLERMNRTEEFEFIIKQRRGINPNSRKLEAKDDDGGKNVLRFRDWSGFASESTEDYTLNEEEEPSMFSPQSPMFSFFLGSILILLAATLVIIAVIVTLKMIRYLQWRRRVNDKKAVNIRKIIIGSSRHSLDVPKNDMYTIWNERFRAEQLDF